MEGERYREEAVEDLAPLVPLIVADVYQLAGAFRAVGERIARSAGQTQARWQLLSAASAGIKTVPQIARRLGYARQSVQRTADLLVESGLAEFAANPDHQRSPYLELTTQGRDVLKRLSAAAKKTHAQLAEHSRGADLRTALRVLRELCAAIDPLDGEIR